MTMPMPMIFLHLTDAVEGDAVRIRMDLIHAMWVQQDKEDILSHSGGTVATKANDPFTMIVYGPHGTMHGVRETIGEVESQMADAYELAGIAAL